METPGSRRRAVEECHRLPVWAFTAGARPAGSELLDLAYTPQKLGGVRTWLVCPGCERRTADVYQPTRGVPWLCRHCHGLTYLSRRHSKRDEAMWRALAEMYAILDGNGGDWTPLTAMLETAPTMKAIAMSRALIRVYA